MNQKNYKEIAGIIKRSPRYMIDKIRLANELADYFEREDYWLGDDGKKKKGINFNKKQFLKGCGVSE